MSLKTAQQAFNYAKGSYQDVSIEIAKQYKKALDVLRIELSKINESGKFTDTDMLKYGRLVNLKKLIDDEMKVITKGTYKIIDSARIKTFYNAYSKFYEEAGLTLPKFNRDFVRSALANPLYESKFVDSLSDLTKKNAKGISDIITQNLIQGKTIAETAKAIKAKFEDYSTYQARLIAKQETLRALTEGQLTATEKLKERGFKVVKIWVYNHSPKFPREYHQSMHGQEADKDGYFVINSPIEGIIYATAPRMSGYASNDVGCSCSYYNEIRE